MKANPNSWHARLYKFIYESKNLPKNLCPYFWKCVLAILLFVPAVVIKFPSLVITTFDKNIKYSWLWTSHWQHGTKCWCIIILVFAWLLLQYHWICAMLGTYSYDWRLANFGWIIDGFIAIVFGTMWICELHNDYQRKRNFERKSQAQTLADKEGIDYWEAYNRLFVKSTKTKYPNLFIEFIKATYHKYCPQIEWEESK